MLQSLELRVRATASLHQMTVQEVQLGSVNSKP